MKMTQKIKILVSSLLILPFFSAVLIAPPTSAYVCPDATDGVQHVYKDGACYLPPTSGQGDGTKINNEQPVHNDGTPIAEWECASGLKYNASKHTCEKCQTFGGCKADTKSTPTPKGVDKTTAADDDEDNGSGTEKDPASKNKGGTGECAGVKTDYFACDGDGADAIVGVIKIAILIVSVGVGIVAVGGIVYGAILYSSAQDSQDQIRKSLTIIKSVVIGLLLYVFMVAIINFLVPGGVFGSGEAPAAECTTAPEDNTTTGNTDQTANEECTTAPEDNTTTGNTTNNNTNTNNTNTQNNQTNTQNQTNQQPKRQTGPFGF